eukprot:4229830-Amphidinium_carterae.1
MKFTWGSSVKTCAGVVTVCPQTSYKTPQPMASHRTFLLTTTKTPKGAFGPAGGRVAQTTSLTPLAAPQHEGSSQFFISR